MENEKNITHDFDSISPSAISLIAMKGQTELPYARQTAALIKNSDKYIQEAKSQELRTFLMRITHFESRYLSINSLLHDLPINNILELCSGYSFRGLDLVNSSKIHFIDTDLDAVIENKKQIIKELEKDGNKRVGELELLSLNALDEQGFQDVVSHFPSGEIAVINEGLLMYLDDSEKEKLCNIIRNILKLKGGYWITADIYLKQMINRLNMKIDNKTQEFFDQHNIEEKRFDSFETAEAFFNKMGFVIDKEADVDPKQISSLENLMKNMSLEQQSNIQNSGKINATWRLKLAD